MTKAKKIIRLFKKRHGQISNQTLAWECDSTPTYVENVLRRNHLRRDFYYAKEFENSENHKIIKFGEETVVLRLHY